MNDRPPTEHSSLRDAEVVSVRTTSTLYLAKCAGSSRCGMWPELLNSMNCLLGADSVQWPLEDPLRDEVSDHERALVDAG